MTHPHQTGFTAYDDSTFGFAGQAGTRCVYEPGIVAGTGLEPDDATYVLGPDTYNGQPQPAPTYEFVVGAGHVAWKNIDQVSSSLDCDNAHPCDVVIRVQTTVGTVGAILTMNYAADVVSTTTTTTVAPTATAPPTTVVPTSAPTVLPASFASPATTVPTSTTGKLALTGTGTRDLLSVALVVLAAGLFALAQSFRRARHP